MKRLLAPWGRSGGDDIAPAAGTFLRGLSLGALIGAAIAGSALLQRRRHEQAEVAARPSDRTPPDGGDAG